MDELELYLPAKIYFHLKVSLAGVEWPGGGHWSGEWVTSTSAVEWARPDVCTCTCCCWRQNPNTTTLIPTLPMLHFTESRVHSTMCPSVSTHSCSLFSRGPGLMESGSAARDSNQRSVSGQFNNSSPGNIWGHLQRNIFIKSLPEEFCVDTPELSYIKHVIHIKIEIIFNCCLYTLNFVIRWLLKSYYCCIAR